MKYIRTFPVALACLFLIDMAQAQTYPSRPIRIVTASPGGGTDFATRLIAQGLGRRLPQPVIVENKGGAIVAVDSVAKAAPDGYTLLLYANAMWVAPLMQEVRYDPVKDFAPITLVGKLPNILAVHPSLAVNSVRELIAYAKGNPGQLSYASSGNGSSTHLAGELFKSMTGLDILHVPYKSAGPALTDVVSGRVKLMFATSGSVAPHLKSGKLKALAVTTTKPTVLVPGLPTVAEFVPGYESVSMVAMFAPAKTSPGIVGQLNREIVQVLRDPEIRQKFNGAGTEVIGSTQQELAATVKLEMERLGKVIRDAGIHAGGQK